LELRVLVTGGAGYVGRHVASLLSAEGCTVHVTDVRDPPEFNSDVRFVRGDLTKRSFTRSMVRNIDVVVHLAGLLSDRCALDAVAATKANPLASVELLSAAADSGVERVVLASSIAVFGPDESYQGYRLPLGDGAATAGAQELGLYSAGKIYLEACARQFSATGGLEVTGLRPGVVYGGERAGGRTAFIAEWCALARSGESIVVPNGAVVSTIVHVADVARAFCVLATAPRGSFPAGHFFNLSGDRLSLGEIARAIQRICPQVELDIRGGEQKALLGMATRISDDGIGTLMGFQRIHTPFEEAIKSELTGPAAERASR
jgi:UDP-glucose 4-epimerase